MARRQTLWPEGYASCGAGEGTQIHRREEMVIRGLVKPELCLVIRVYADRIVTTVEPWKETG